jgi:hypothetical protein
MNSSEGHSLERTTKMSKQESPKTTIRNLQKLANSKEQSTVSINRISREVLKETLREKKVKRPVSKTRSTTLSKGFQKKPKH